ncbi:MAG: hypothetical protein EU535_07825 [Promethearchaeota archaeon]|nr:MAG: hypothetical protein EU535_07825 [Candidatus Lokiarchaeota archaeon]
MFTYFKKRTKKNKLKILFITTFLFTLSSPILFTIDQDGLSHGIEKNFPLSSDYWILTGIHVNNNWSLTESTYDWCTGSGTIGDPYLIENVTIDAQGRSGIMIEHTNEYFRIQNCTINNTGYWNDAGSYYEAGIRISYADNGVIHNNTIYDTEYAGLSIVHAENNNITENKLSQNDLWALYMNIVEDLLIKNNSVNGDFVDVGLIRCTYITMKNNTLFQGGITITADNLQQATTHSIDQFNTVNGKSIYYYKYRDNLVPKDFLNAGQIILASCSNSTISNCAISTVYAGIELFYSEYITIESCNFTSCEQISIRLDHSFNNTLRNNRFINRYGIELRYSDENEVSNNYFYNNVRPIQLAGYCENNNISHNEVKDSSYGIALATSCSNNKVYQNNITNCAVYGIYLWRYCDANEIYDNKVEEGAMQAIYLNNDCDSNIIRNNSIIDNLYGVYLATGCDINGVYNNTFELNGLHAFDDGLDNYWNFTNIGNYWDNYTGVDLNDDNIGDNPYLISGASLSADYAPIWSDGDDLAPHIDILNPSDYSYYNEVPIIDVSVSDVNEINQTWYTIIGSGENYTFETLSFEVNSSLWMSQAQGSFTLRIFANDSVGNLGYDDLVLIKDTINPFLMINSPLSGAEFGTTPPTINITITEANFFQFWFTINDSSTLHFVAASSGENTFSIESSIWDLIPEGHVLITFFANDTLGQTGTISITILKEIPEEPSEPPSIPGFNVLVLLFFSLFSVIVLSRMQIKKN